MPEVWAELVHRKPSSMFLLEQSRQCVSVPVQDPQAERHSGMIPNTIGA